MTFYGRRKSEDHQPFKFRILRIVIITQSNARQTAFNYRSIFIAAFPLGLASSQERICFVKRVPNLGPVDVSKNTSHARLRLKGEVNFSHCLYEIFHLTGLRARWDKVSLLRNQNELANKNQRIISIHLTILAVFLLYGRFSHHPGEILPLVRWDFIIPVV